MKLAVCLLTADRSDYTADTCSSFVTHTEEPGMILLHADDGSETRSNRLIAQAAGFETVYTTKERRGPLNAVKKMWAAAATLGATHILHLENDNEFCGPLPRGEFYGGVDCVRLYGRFKSRPGTTRRDVGPHLMGTKIPILWIPYSRADHEGRRYERGRAHWAGLPSITKTEHLLRAAVNAETFKDLSMTLQQLDTLRAVENISNHIGEARTPNAKFNQ